MSYTGINRRANEIHNEGLALIGKGRVMDKLGNKDEAKRLYEKGISRFESVRRYAGLLEMRKGYQESLYKYYEEVALFMLNNGYYKEGYRYIDGMKVRVFLDMLA